MENRRKTYTIRQLVRLMENKTVAFDYPIQRESGQWDKYQKSLLIHTIFQDYLVPDIYIIKEGTEDFSPMSVLDGKQRLTTMFSFYKDEFKLEKDIDSVIIKTPCYQDGKLVNVDEKEYQIAGKRYSEIDGALKEHFMDFGFDTKLLANYSDDEIEEQFYRLNNGSTFTKAQKANVKLGTDLAGKIKEIEECDFFVKRASFSATQRKRGEVTSCILQTLMLLTGYEYKSFGAGEVLKFAEYFNENPNSKQIEYCKELFDKLFEVLPYTKDIDKQLKKIHIPMLIMNLDAIGGLDIEYEVSDDEYASFLTRWFDVLNETSGYIDYCGQGSTSKAKVEGRLLLMEKELREYVIKLMMEGEQKNENDEEENIRIETAS